MATSVNSQQRFKTSASPCPICGGWERMRRGEGTRCCGYLALTLQMPDGTIHSIMAHRIIWEWANGPIPEGMQINHKDLNKQNNRIDNLELATNLENMRHSFAHDRTRAWEHIKAKRKGNWRPGKPIMTEEQRMLMYTMRVSGASLNQISQATGYSPTYISRVVRDLEVKHAG